MNIFNIDFINNIFVNSAKHVTVLSPHLSNALLDNWNRLNSSEYTKGTKKAKESLLKNIDKLGELEEKKEVDLKAIVKSNIALIRSIQSNVDKEYAENLIKRIRKTKSLKEIFLVLLDRLESSVIRTVKKKEKKHNVKYVLDDNGYIYANMTYKNGVLSFDKNSFTNEVYHFNQALKNDENLELVIPEKYGNKLSPNERKRRVYINSMFKLNRSISKMPKKDLDILFPIDRFYKFSSVIAANLYKELFEYSNNDLGLNKLWQETIKNYGSAKSLSLYEEAYWNFVKRYKSLDKDIAQEYKNVIYLAKEKKDNVLFNKSKNPIPSTNDIISALSILIIQKISDNLKYYLVDFKNRVKESIRHMDTKDMVSFYRTFKLVLKRDSKLTKYISILQKTVANELSIKNEKDVEICVKKYLREEVLF